MAEDADISGFLKALSGEALQRAQTAAKRAMDRGGEAILARARKLAPVSPTNPQHPLYIGTSGSLRDSGTALPAEIDAAGNVTKQIGFNTNYAAAVHERLDQNHRYPGAVNPNAQAKFLEQPLKELAAKVAEMVANEVKKEFTK